MYSRASCDPQGWLGVIDLRTVPVRFSRLKKMALSPAHYLAAVQAGDDPSDSLAMRIGRGGHAILFGQPVALWTGKTRNGAAWEEFKIEHQGCEILNVKEHDQAASIVTALQKHDLASKLLSMPGSVVERPIDWAFMGRACRSTPDVRHSIYANHIIDLKTARSTEPDRFVRAATWMHYHAQLAFYCDAVEFTTGERPAQAYIVAVESAPPYAVTVLRLTERALDQGARLCRLWFERLLSCEASNEWPAYAQSVVDFDVPDQDEFRLTIDGEDVEVP